jgi:hypothetical protein
MGKIYMSHGNKGGVGKSQMAACIVDTLLKNDPNKFVVVVDGDTPEEQRKVGGDNSDVGPRFENHPRVLNVVTALNDPREGSDAIYRALDSVFDKVEKAYAVMDEDFEMEFDIVINTPATFSQTFDKEAQEKLIKFANDVGFGMRIVYIVGETDKAKAEAINFLETTVYPVDDVVFAIPTRTVEEAQWLADPAISKLTKMQKAFFIPKMSRELVAMYDGNKDRSIGFFYSTDLNFDINTISFRERLRYRMFKDYSDMFSDILNESVI